MFFFIAGVQPKTIDLDGHPRTCPSCGLYQAYLKRVDQYLSIFFLPLVRIKKGVPFLECRSCGNLSSESGEDLFQYQEMRKGRKCKYCGKRLESEFHFCPFCGNPV